MVGWTDQFSQMNAELTDLTVWQRALKLQTQNLELQIDASQYNFDVFENGRSKSRELIKSGKVPSLFFLRGLF